MRTVIWPYQKLVKLQWLLRTDMVLYKGVVVFWRCLGDMLLVQQRRLALNAITHGATAKAMF